MAMAISACMATTRACCAMSAAGSSQGRRLLPLAAAAEWVKPPCIFPFVTAAGLWIRLPGVCFLPDCFEKSPALGHAARARYAFSGDREVLSDLKWRQIINTVWPYRESFVAAMP